MIWEDLTCLNESFAPTYSTSSQSFGQGLTAWILPCPHSSAGVRSRLSVAWRRLLKDQPTYGNGWNPTYKNAHVGDGLWLCLTNIGGFDEFSYHTSQDWWRRITFGNLAFWSRKIDPSRGNSHLADDCFFFPGERTPRRTWDSNGNSCRRAMRVLRWFHITILDNLPVASFAHRRRRVSSWTSAKWAEKKKQQWQRVVMGIAAVSDAPRTEYWPTFPVPYKLPNVLYISLYIYIYIIYK